MIFSTASGFWRINSEPCPFSTIFEVLLRGQSQIPASRATNYGYSFAINIELFLPVPFNPFNDVFGICQYLV